MSVRTRVLKAAILAGPLGVLAVGAQAADIASTIAEQEQFSKLAEVIEAAGLAKSLEGDGPYTVFAPTNQAFERLPAGLQDALINEENRDQLERMLQHHVVEGEEIMAQDVLGKQTEVETVSGDRLSVDGTGQAILLVPQQNGQRQQPAQAPGQQEGVETEVAEESGMPTSEHQQEVLAEEPATEQRQTAQEGDMPASPHQEQVLRDEPADMEQRQTAQESGLPASPHQEQVLRDEPAAEQPGGQDMRATVTEADIKADNGVIHAIDVVLIPQSVLSMLDGAGMSSQDEPSGTQQSTDEQG